MPRRNPLSQLFGLQDGIGQVPDNSINWAIGEMSDNYKANNPEMQRQLAIISAADERAEQGLRRDTEAYNLGFGGKYPQRQMAEYKNQSELAKLLRPAEARAKADATQLAEEQKFRAEQEVMNRAARMEQEKFKQGAMDQRAREKAAAALEYAKRTGKTVDESWISSLFGGDEEEVAPQASAAPVAPASSRYRVVSR